MECKFDATYPGAVQARVCAASARGRQEAACQVFIQNERLPLTVRESLRAGQLGFSQAAHCQDASAVLARPQRDLVRRLAGALAAASVAAASLQARSSLGAVS